MPFLIATDEAGLGPNLGPLVVSATVWEMPEGVAAADMFEPLAEAIVSSTREANEQRFVVGDSKQLYKPGGTLRSLERGVFVALRALGRNVNTWRDLFNALDPLSAENRNSTAWYADYDASLPLDVAVQDLDPLCQRFLDVTSRSGIRLHDVRSRVVYPSQFNRQLESYGKGELLSHTTLGLVAELAAPLTGSISIVCDKHGGRNRYADLLAQHFPDQFIEIRGESRQSSAYAFGPPQRRFEACFRMKAEAVLAVGLASMVSKYLRELSMAAFNQFWCGQVEDLRPTAGYPQDAKRFRQALGDLPDRLGIGIDTLWRRK